MGTPAPIHLAPRKGVPGEELRRKTMGKIEEKNPIDYFFHVNVALQYFAVYIDCVDDTYLKLLQSCGALKVSPFCLVGARFLKAGSKIGFFPTLSILTPQNWRHFDGPTPVQVHSPETIGGSNRWSLGSYDFAVWPFQHAQQQSREIRWIPTFPEVCSVNKWAVTTKPTRDIPIYWLVFRES